MVFFFLFASYHGDRGKKKSKTGEDGRYHTAQVGPGSSEDERSAKKWNGLDLDLIWI